MRWSEGVEANDFFTKKRGGGVGVSSRENVARDDDDSFAPAAVRTPWPLRRLPNEPRGTRVAPRSPPPPPRPRRTKSTTRRGRRSPRCATRFRAFQPGTRATPLGARGIPKARRIHDPTTGESPGGVAFDAFGAHPGVRAARFVPGEAKRPAGPAGPAGPAATSPRGAPGKEGRRHRRRRRRLARPSRRSTPRSSRRSARRRHARCARTTSAPPGRRSGARRAARAHALEGWQERRRPPDKNAASPPRRHRSAARTRVAVADDGDDGIRATDICDDRGGDREGDREGGHFATATKGISRTHASAVRTERKENAYAPGARTKKWTRSRRAWKPPCTRSSPKPPKVSSAATKGRVRPRARRLTPCVWRRSMPPRSCSRTGVRVRARRRAGVDAEADAPRLGALRRLRRARDVLETALDRRARASIGRCAANTTAPSWCCGSARARRCRLRVT